MSPLNRPLSGEEITASMREHIEAAKDEPANTWWLSFVHPDRPAGDRSVGVVLIDACRSFDEAFLRCTLAGVNPDGECRGVGFDRAHVSDDQWLALSLLPRLTLLSKADLVKAGVDL
jgi:hypothetical protein